MPLFVITGGPCSGKTTLINALAKKKLRTVPESAALCIAEMLKEELAPEMNFELLQERIFSLQRMKEDELLADKRLAKESVFLDRSLIDVCAYFWVRNKNAPKQIYDRAAQARYEKVFLLSLLPELAQSVKQNGIRYEQDPDEAFRIQAQLRKAYASFGCTIVEVPAVSVEERIALVLKEIGPAP